MRLPYGNIWVFGSRRSGWACGVAWPGRLASRKRVAAKAFWDLHFLKYCISPGRLKGDARGGQGKGFLMFSSGFLIFS